MDGSSMALRTIVRGGRIVTMDGDIRADLVIDDHHVVAMLAVSSGVDGDTTIDATDLLVLPGMVATWFPAPCMHDINASEASGRVTAAATAGGIDSTEA